MSMGTLMYDEHPIYNLGYVEQADFREVLDQDKYGLYRRKGYKIPHKYKKEYRKLRYKRNECVIECFKKEHCRETLKYDIILLIELLRMG